MTQLNKNTTNQIQLACKSLIKKTNETLTRTVTIESSMQATDTTLFDQWCYISVFNTITSPSANIKDRFSQNLSSETTKKSTEKMKKNKCHLEK